MSERESGLAKSVDMERDLPGLALGRAVELLALLDGKELSAIELLDLYLQRVDALNPEINAVVARDDEAARATAADVDQARARGKPVGPLAGLPMTIKDSFEVVGMTATCGLPPLANHRPEADADAVRRLRDAGAVIFGKTNLPAAAADWQSYNELYGVTRNPWNLERTVGGSSGGAAAAVAAGMTAFELGSDIAGSIRIPSHFCGVFGHKPSYGIVPLRGHIPPPPGGLSAPQLGVAGPIARSAADLDLALNVLVGPREGEATGWKLELPAARHEQLDSFRVGVWLGGGSYHLDGAYRDALTAFAEDVEQAGARVADVELPFDPEVAYDVYLRTLFAVVGAGEPGQSETMLALAAGDETGYAARLGHAIASSLPDWFALLEQREHLFRAWRAFFEDVDILLCPVAMTVAFPHDIKAAGATDEQLERRLIVSGEPRPYFDNFAWASIATCANLPATAIPTGRFVDGLPAGVQAIGPYLEDRTTLRFAQLVEEQGIGGFTPPPIGG